MGFKKMSHDLEKNGKFFLKSTNFPTPWYWSRQSTRPRVLNTLLNKNEEFFQK